MRQEVCSVLDPFVSHTTLVVGLHFHTGSIQQSTFSTAQQVIATLRVYFFPTNPNSMLILGAEAVEDLFWCRMSLILSSKETAHFSRECDYSV